MPIVRTEPITLRKTVHEEFLLLTPAPIVVPQEHDALAETRAVDVAH
jgi:hypothetical protein